MIKSLLKASIIGLILVVSSTAFADVTLAKHHPNVYYVKDGDTLWGIANKFLQDPWKWPQIWQKNQQISNPHLIYPGDELHLRYVNGKPQITLKRGEKGKQAIASVKNADSGYPTVKLSPEIESHPLSSAIPSVSLDSVQSFLLSGRVVTKEQIEKAPYLLGGEDGRSMWGKGDKVYIRHPDSKWNNKNANYGIYRVGERYVDPETKEVLGYEALLIGHLQPVSVKGDIATMKVTSSRQGLRQGDRIFTTVKHEQLATFFPEVPDDSIKATIIRMFGAVNSVAKNDVVVINKGKRDGLKEGNLLEIKEPGGVVEDKQMKQYVQLPAERAGNMLLFRVFDKVSYGLIMKSLKPIKKTDLVVTPD